jgi:hypothetical protein
MIDSVCLRYGGIPQSTRWQGRKRDSAGGPARFHEGSGSRDLSDGHLFLRRSPDTARSERVCLPTRSVRSSPFPRLIRARSERARSSPRSSEMRRRSFAAEAETAASTARPQDVPEESAGTTASRPATAAACRERPTSPLPFWTCSGYLDEIQGLRRV